MAVCAWTSVEVSFPLDAVVLACVAGDFLG